jgi:hypothetical protein
MTSRATTVNSGLRNDKTRTGWIVESLVYPLSVLLTILFAVPVSAQNNTASVSFSERGGVSITTAGTSNRLGVGYVRINQTGAVAAGFATFGLRLNNVLVSEATVPAADYVSKGRIYAEIGGGVDTGIAIVNPASDPVQIAFYFTDSSGTDFGLNAITVPAKGQVVQFLSQAPFSGRSGLVGSFTFFALRSDPNTKVAAIAIRGVVNERGDFLMTTLPIVPLEQQPLFSGSTLSHFASGQGWTTQVLLVNQTENVLDGKVTFLDQAGQPATVDSELGQGSSFNYRVAAKSAFRLRTSDTTTLRVGSVRISNSASSADIPVGFLVFSYRSGGVTVSSTGVPSVRTASAARLFVEAAGAGGAGSLQTGVAVANVSNTAVRVSFDVTNLDGSSTGFRGDVDIPAGGQTAKFLKEIPGFAALPVPFQGVLRISAPTASIAVIGLRGRYNERAEFLASTIPTVNENDAYFNSVLQYSPFVFPHFADGAGYSTQFVLFSGWNSGSVTGNLEFLTPAGEPYPVELRPR